MHRLRLHRIPHGARLNSTAAEASTPTLSRKRGITLRWGNVIIPSREEVLSLNIPKESVYSPDLSYLDNAPRNPVAGRLAKPIPQPIDISSITEKRREERLARERKNRPPDIAAITKKRIEERLAREAARDARKAHNFNEAIRTVQDNADILNSLRPLLNSPGPLPLAQASTKPPAERPDDELSPSALKRREERRLRENSVSQDRRPPRSNKGRTRSGDITAAENKSLDSVDSAELEAASPTVHAPEFNGPESISVDGVNNNFGVVRLASAHGEHSTKVSDSSSYHLSSNVIDSLTEGDYSAYTSLSSTSNSTSPNALTVVNTAELALSYQRDYIIPQRERAIDIVKTLVGANFVQATKETA